jgi:hypothetical protein
MFLFGDGIKEVSFKIYYLIPPFGDPRGELLNFDSMIIFEISACIFDIFSA